MPRMVIDIVHKNLAWGLILPNDLLDYTILNKLLVIVYLSKSCAKVDQMKTIMTKLMKGTVFKEKAEHSPMQRGFEIKKKQGIHISILFCDTVLLCSD